VASTFSFFFLHLDPRPSVKSSRQSPRRNLLRPSQTVFRSLFLRSPPDFFLPRDPSWTWCFFPVSVSIRPPPSSPPLFFLSQPHISPHGPPSPKRRIVPYTPIFFRLVPLFFFPPLPSPRQGSLFQTVMDDASASYSFDPPDQP